MDNSTHYEQAEYFPLKKPLLFIISGPSGVGKDAVLDKLKTSSLPIRYIVTTTTRSRRENEIDGIHYKFVSREHFQELIDSNSMLEWANVYGNMYGVPATDIEEALVSGQDVMVKVDIQGVENYKKIFPDAVSIFLMPPSLEDLTTRLKGRRTESASSLEVRLKKASEEMKKQQYFDYAVINRWGEINQAVSDIKAIITAENCRIRR
jgi:guanylate kinase